MEDIKNLIFSTPFQIVLDCLLKHSDLAMSDAELTAAISGAKRAAIHQSLVMLSQYGITLRTHQGRRCLNTLNQAHPWIAPLKVVSSILDLEPFVSAIQGSATKAVLFGSRATGTNRHDSDYDILVVSTNDDAIAHASLQTTVSDKLHVLIKTPEALLNFDDREPVLAEHIRRGIVLWER